MKKIIRMAAMMMALILCSMNSMEIHAEGLQLEIKEIQKSEQREATDGEGTEKDPPQEDPIHVLLVGNSFTRRSSGSYTVEQPLEELARVNGHNLEVTTLAHNGARLFYYAGQSQNYLSYNQELTELLANQSWDYIIFQEHTTVPIEEFDTHMYPAVETLLQMVKQSQPQATPLLYMTAGYENGQTVNVNGVDKILTTAEHQLYTAAANKTLENKLGIEAVPVGMHSLRVNKLYPEIKMVSSDSKHPSFAGYYLAACSFYQRIYGTVPDPAGTVLTNCNLTNDQLVALAALTEDSLKLDQKDISLTVNETKSLNAVISGNMEETSSVTFRSFDSGIAAVDGTTGEVVAKAVGSTVIMAETSGGLQAFCNITVKPEEVKEDPIHVLIVGNSFTQHSEGGKVYTVEQPLEELAKANGHNLEVTSLSHGSAKLRYYAGQSQSYFSYCRELMVHLVSQSWDYIIFQEQTTVPIENFDTYMYPAVEALLQMVKQFQPQATPLLYMTAGYENGTLVKVNGVSRTLTTAEHQLFTAVSYKTLENKLGVEAIPVGMHSLRANILYPQIKMVGSDSKHPSYAGYYLAACSFYQRIYGTVPNPAGVSLTNCNLTNEQLTALASLTGDSLTLKQKDITLTLNKAQSLSAILSSQNTKSSTIAYKSFDSSVATVNASTGVVTAKGGGSTVIVAATSDGLQAFCNVTVRIPLSFGRSEYIAGIGDVMQIVPRTNTTNLKWSSNKSSVASVGSATGLVTAKTSGKAVITVTNEDDAADKASYTVYVTCAVPIGLKAASTGNPAEGAKAGKIKVSWSKVTGANGYEIYRSTSKSGTYSLIGTSKSTSYTDKTAKVNQTYYYKVKAANGYAYCTSPLSSNTRGIILKAPTVTAKRVSKKYVKLTWKKNTKATGYVIYRSTKKNSGYKKIATLTSKAKVSYTDKTVKKNKTYYYRIKAYRTLDKKTFYGVKSVRVKIKI